MSTSGTYNFSMDIDEVIQEANVDDESIVTDVEELARLRKVYEFIDNLLKAIDPELVPLSTWVNFQKQCRPCLTEVINYSKTRNIQHIVNTNINADNLITYVRPYVVESGKAAKAAQTAFRGYSVVIADGLKNFKNKLLNI